MAIEDTQGPIGLRPVEWQLGTVEKIVEETYRAKTFTFRLSKWRRFRAGQHYDVRLTAPDGYQAQRSYSIASAPEDEDVIDLTIELISDGEVSPYFHEVVQVGDEIELRGPIGGPFTWSRNIGGPLLVVGGGSGIVPLMSMIRHRANVTPETQGVLLYSARSLDDVIYHEELEERVENESELNVVYTFTRYQPSEWQGYARRVDQQMLRDVVGQMDGTPQVYVCGPTGFVESVADHLVRLDIPAENVRTERFGPSGS